MRIALCADGRSPHTERWANAVADRGHEVALVWTRSDFAAGDIAGYRDSIAHHQVSDPANRRRLGNLPLAPLQARRLAAEIKPDLVHGLYLSGYGWIAHSFGVHPLVLSALGTDVLDLEPRLGDRATVIDRLSARYIVRATRAAVAGADLVLTDSASLAEGVQRAIPTAETRIIRFGVEIQAPVSGARRHWRQRLAVDEDAFVLLSTRLLRPTYNIERIIEALPAIRERCPGTVLVLKELPQFSDPSYRESCLNMAQALGVSDALRLVGELERSELLELYSVADAYVSVPSTDGTAVSVFEAMAAGVAVLATDAPGIDPEILRNDESALLVPVGDTESLAAAAVKLGVDPTLRRRLAEAGREVVRRYADFDRELDDAVHLYEELLIAQANRVGDRA